jgi:hypothetical protein
MIWAGYGAGTKEMTNADKILLRKLVGRGPLG